MTNDAKIGKYDEEYYNQIWRKNLSRFKINSPVHDFGDVNRALCLGKCMGFVLSKVKSEGDLNISDFGAGNWLYLSAIYNAVKNWKQQNKKVTLKGYDFSSVALNWGIEKYSNEKPGYMTVLPITGNIDEILKTEPKNSLDLIISLETLEHLEDDDGAMKKYFDLLKVGGSLIASVPNTMHIFLSKDWFQYEKSGREYIEKDRRVGHYRRYNFKQMKDKLERAGFKVENQLGYGFFFHDYFDSFFSKIRNEKIRAFLFPAMKVLNQIENSLCNNFHIEKSAAFFTIAKKEK